MSDKPDNVIPLFKDRRSAEEVKGLMVAHWEAAFAAVGQTLTDEENAKSLRAAVGMMDMLTQGACAVGDISEEQRDSLRWWLHTGLHAADEMQE